MTLSEKDRRSLMVLAQELRAEDPRLAEALTAGARPSNHRGPAWTVTILLIAVAALTVLVGCLTDRPGLGAAGGVLFLLSVTLLAVLHVGVPPAT